jgi:hypothetical protein
MFAHLVSILFEKKLAKLQAKADSTARESKSEIETI